MMRKRMMELTTTPTTTRRSLQTATIFLSAVYHHAIIFFILFSMVLCVLIGSTTPSILMVDAFAFVGTRTTTHFAPIDTTTTQQQQQQQTCNHQQRSSSCCVCFPHYAAAKKEKEEDTTVTVESSSSESTTTTKNDKRGQHTTGSRNTPRFEKQWKDNYKKLKAYHKVHGHCDVPQLTLSLKDYDDDTDTLNLGRWVSTQRTLYKHGRLREDRMDKLNKLGFNWKVTSLGRRPKISSLSYKSWDETYEDLTEFYNKNGHSNVPQKEGNLGQWVKAQRDFNNNHQNKLSQERIDKLNKLDFKWKIGQGNSYNDKLWLSKYDELQKFKHDHGNCNVPANTSSLGLWVQNQRAFYLKNKLRVDRKQLLDDIGFEFVLRRR